MNKSSNNTFRNSTHDKFKNYRLKRDFRNTPEPGGAPALEPPGETRAFVIQKHNARRLHYDLRLELEDSLKSWAVPKGPSLNPAEKRLAVQVEDHPLEYAGFEGTIPAGEYGAGEVIVWDRGTWKPLTDDPLVDYQKGHLKFLLEGEKLNGAWVLIRMKGNSQDGSDWLLIKEQDEFAGPDSDVLLKDTSVLSGRTIEEIKHGKKARAVQPINSQLLPGSKEPFPSRAVPQLASVSVKPPEGEEWLHEIKLDGHRILAEKRKDGNVNLRTRNRKDWSARFRQVSDALGAVAADSFLLDGEVCVVDGSGKTSFSALQSFIKEGSKASLTYFVFDLLYLNGFSLMGLPLLKRKELLQQLLSSAGESEEIMYVEHVRGNGPEFFSLACQQGLEGIISKKLSRPYRMARSRDWVKIKCDRREAFLICGFTIMKKSRGSIGALLLGQYQGKVLRYMGRVGTGFSDKTRKELFLRLQSLKISSSPFNHSPRVRGATYCNPEIKAQVRFTEVTDAGRLRHPVFLQLQEERPVGRPENKMGTKSDTPSDRLTHPDKQLFETPSLTKATLASYYEHVAKFMLKELSDRPLVLVRCPDGSGNKCFYQKNIDPKAYSDVRTIKVPGAKKNASFAGASHVSDLRALVQLNVLEIHCWGARRDNLESPDRMVFDLDPDPGLPVRVVKEAGLLIRALLSHLGLESFVRTTGGKGIHVVSPLRRVSSWKELKLFTREIARLVESHDPALFTSVMSKARRNGKIFIDYFRNQRGASSIANYSTRARRGAPIAVPISWDELNDIPAFNYFNIENTLERMSSISKDPWERCYTLRQQLKKSAFYSLGLDDAAHKDNLKNKS